MHNWQEKPCGAIGPAFLYRRLNVQSASCVELLFSQIVACYQVETGDVYICSAALHILR